MPGLKLLQSGLLRTQQLNTSQMCSIGDILGDLAGHGSALKSCCLRQLTASFYLNLGVPLNIVPSILTLYSIIMPFDTFETSCIGTCVDKYSEGLFGHIRYCKLDFL